MPTGAPNNSGGDDFFFDDSIEQTYLEWTHDLVDSCSRWTLFVRPLTGVEGGDRRYTFKRQPDGSWKLERTSKAQRWVPRNPTVKDGKVSVEVPLPPAGGPDQPHIYIWWVEAVVDEIELKNPRNGSTRSLQHRLTLRSADRLLVRNL